jgi:hypothetical protein
MPDQLRVSRVRWVVAGPAQLAGGVIGYVDFVLNDALAVRGVQLRRTLAGRLAISWPRDARARPVVFPIDDAARLELERQVFAALDFKPETSP